MPASVRWPSIWLIASIAKRGFVPPTTTMVVTSDEVEKIKSLYGTLHRKGHAHSVEAWEGDQLVGGLYGVSLGAAFFGESMFSRRTDASKICLVHLVERLKTNGFRLLDTQFTTEHLKTFGAIDVPKIDYEDMLANALASPHLPF